jgi:hypothetical protein
MLRKVMLSVLMSMSAFAAHQVEVNVNNQEVEAQVRFDVGQMNNVMNNTYIGARFLNGDTSNSRTFESADPLAELSFMIMRPFQGVSGLNMGLGIKGEFTKVDDNRYMALPLGVEADMRVLPNIPVPMFVGGALYYAPSALSFKEGDEYLEGRIHLDIEPIDNGRIELGYRKIDTDLKSRDVTYNSTWYFGFRLDF